MVTSKVPVLVWMLALHAITVSSRPAPVDSSRPFQPRLDPLSEHNLSTKRVRNEETLATPQDPPRYWATVKDHEMSRMCPLGCENWIGMSPPVIIAEFDCWYLGEYVAGNNTWFRGLPQITNGVERIWWWPKASLEKFGEQGEPPFECKYGKNLDAILNLAD